MEDKDRICEYCMMGGLSLIAIALIFLNFVNIQVYGAALGITIFNGLAIFGVASLCHSKASVIKRCS